MPSTQALGKDGLRFYYRSCLLSSFSPRCKPSSKYTHAERRALDPQTAEPREANEWIPSPVLHRIVKRIFYFMVVSVFNIENELMFLWVPDIYRHVSHPIQGGLEFAIFFSLVPVLAVDELQLFPSERLIISPLVVAR
jgi:hypothetical protein